MEVRKIFVERIKERFDEGGKVRLKKIPTLFERVYENHKICGINETVTPGMEWVLRGEGIATVKMDGSCCAVMDGKFYRRYDAKRGKKPPKSAIPCCEPDPVTGHWPHWLPVNEEDKGDQWLCAAYRNTLVQQDGISGSSALTDGTYEAIGPHFQANPYKLEQDVLEKHGARILTDVPRDFCGIRTYLGEHNIEGIVFWKDNEPQCKIKRTDFGFKWPAE